MEFLKFLHCILSASVLVHIGYCTLSEECDSMTYICHMVGNGLIYADPGLAVLTEVTYTECLQYCTNSRSCKVVQYDVINNECRFNSFLSNDMPYTAPAPYEVFWKAASANDCLIDVISQGILSFHYYQFNH